MISIDQAFCQSASASRIQFLEAAATASAQIHSFGEHPEANDIAIDGDPHAQKWLIVVSEDICDAGVLTFALHDDEWRELASSHGVTVLYAHLLHPTHFDLAQALHDWIPSEAEVAMISLDAEANKNAAPGEIISEARQSMFAEVEAFTS